MSLQSHVSTYFLHVHSGTGAGASARVGIAVVLTFKFLPPWWCWRVGAAFRLQEVRIVLVMKFTICVFAFFLNC